MTVILSAASGGRNAGSRPIVESFRAGGIEPDIRVASAGAEMTELAREAVARREQIVVAGGGDGTISAVAAALVDTSSALGVLPLGTFNHFAKDLRLPLDLEGAVHSILIGRVTSVDVGEVNGRTFLNNSSLGLYPDIVFQRQEQQRRGRGKWVAFLLAALKVMRRFPFLNIRLNADGEQVVRSTPFIFIGNNEYEVEGFNLGTRDCLQAGHLWMYVTPHHATRWDLVRLSANAILGRLRQEKDFEALRVREAWIDTRRRRVRVALDGEVAMLDTPLHYRVRPRALQVVVPALNQ